MENLNRRQEAFCREFLQDYNAAAAAERAGYAPPLAERAGARLLRQPEVRRAIRRAQADAVKNSAVTEDFVVLSLLEVYRRCLGAKPVRGEPGVYRFDSRAALRVLELLGRHLGMFGDRTAPTGPDTGHLARILAQLDGTEPARLGPDPDAARALLRQAAQTAPRADAACGSACAAPNGAAAGAQDAPGPPAGALAYPEPAPAPPPGLAPGLGAGCTGSLAAGSAADIAMDGGPAARRERPALPPGLAPGLGADVAAAADPLTGLAGGGYPGARFFAADRFDARSFFTESDFPDDGDALYDGCGEDGGYGGEEDGYDV